MKGFEVTGRCGVEDVDAVHSQQLVGVLNQLVHVLVVLASVLYPAKNEHCFKEYLTTSESQSLYSGLEP